MSTSYMQASGSLLDSLEEPDAAGLREVEALIGGDDFQTAGSDLFDCTGVASDPVQKYLKKIQILDTGQGSTTQTKQLNPGIIRFIWMIIK